MDRWTKYSYVCQGCDSLFEITCNDPKTYEPQCCGFVIRASVEDATINTTTNKEPQMEYDTVIADTSSQESMAQHYVNNATLIVKDTRDTEMKYVSVTPYDVNVLFTDNDYYSKRIKKTDEMINTVQCIILEAYADSDDQDTLRAIAEALNIKLTKTIEWTATMYVSGSIDVDLLDDFDLESELSDQLSVSAWSGDIEVEDYHVEDAREV